MAHSGAAGSQLHKKAGEVPAAGWVPLRTRGRGTGVPAEAAEQVEDRGTDTEEGVRRPAGERTGTGTGWAGHLVAGPRGAPGRCTGEGRERRRHPLGRRIRAGRVSLLALRIPLRESE